jgi:hypothetical protein
MLGAASFVGNFVTGFGIAFFGEWWYLIELVFWIAVISYLLYLANYLAGKAIRQWRRNENHR